MKKQSPKASKTQESKVKALTHDTVPASIGIVKEVRDELRADIRSTELRLTAKISHLDAKIDHVDSKVEQVLVSVHRTQILMEEQRGENRIVLDGLKNIFERQDRLETDFSDLRGTVSALSAGSKR